jgi:hypothetical protein
VTHGTRAANPRPLPRALRILAIPSLAALACALIVVGPAAADDAWAVRSGQMVMHFNVDLLRDLGVDLEVRGASEEHPDDIWIEHPHWSFPIMAGSDLRFRAEYDAVLPQGGNAGTVRLGGTLVLRERASGRETRIEQLELVPLPPTGSDLPGATGAQTLLMRSGASGLVFCELRNGMYDLRHQPGLQIHYLNAYLTTAWAQAIGRPDLAGWVIGLGEVRAGIELMSSVPPSKPKYQPVFTGGLLDVSLGALSGIQQVAHDGTYPNGQVALSMATTSCNLGQVDVPWYQAMDERHPLIHMAIYRLLNGRLEQIGVSWLKHGFFALSNSQCTPCQNPSNGTFLGVGCSDTYGVSNNSNRNDLGPRNEVNPYFGTWECTGSHFSGGIQDCTRRHGSSGHGPLDHRLVTTDADLANPGATYYYEAYYVVQGDEKLTNNWGYRRCTMTWTGTTWSFSTPSTGNPLVEGPVLATWGDSRQAIPVSPGDGEVLLAVKTTDLGNGSWQYEYALLNKTSDRQVRSFSLPVRGVPDIANISFHDNDNDPSNDWQMTLQDDTLKWQCEAYAQNPNARALMFGYQFNFRFDAPAPPTALNVSLGPFKPDTGTGNGDVGPDVVVVSTGPENVVTGVGDLPRVTARVLEVRPNPFQHNTTIWYQAAPGAVELSIYDATGRRVRTLVDASPGEGVRSVTWNGDAEGGQRVRAGVYYARLRSGTTVSARSLVIMD